MQTTAVLLRIMTIVITNYCKIIKSSDKNLLQITAALIFVKFKIITNYVKFYYIFRQLLVLLQITANFITNFTAGITNCDVITNYMVTENLEMRNIDFGVEVKQQVSCEAYSVG